MRRSIPVVVIALAVLAAPAASAKDPTAPVGSWDLQTTRSLSTGPAGPVRSALTKLIRRRVSFSSTCSQAPCAVAQVTTARGRAVSFLMMPSQGRPYTGKVKILTGLRCRRRPLKATLTMTATLTTRQHEPGDRLTGTTTALALNPGKCALFRGQAGASRTTEFVGLPVNG